MTGIDFYLLYYRRNSGKWREVDIKPVNRHIVKTITYLRVVQSVWPRYIRHCDRLRVTSSSVGRGEINKTVSYIDSWYLCTWDGEYNAMAILSASLKRSRNSKHFGEAKRHINLIFENGDSHSSITSIIAIFQILINQNLYNDIIWTVNFIYKSSTDWT